MCFNYHQACDNTLKTASTHQVTRYNQIINLQRSHRHRLCWYTESLQGTFLSQNRIKCFFKYYEYVNACSHVSLSCFF